MSFLEGFDSDLSLDSSGGVTPLGISFDGDTDYLSRASDFTGNADSSTFTFSCWVYWTGVAQEYIFEIGTVLRFSINIGANGKVQVFGTSSAGSSRINADSGIAVAKNTYTNFIVSCDMSNASNRNMVINDIVDPSPAWGTYNSGTIDFTQPRHVFGARYDFSSPSNLRIYGAFLSREYIDLSVEANRRIFINADGTANTNYLADYEASYGSVTFSFPMNDASIAHINEAGTGDMVQNGTLDTAVVGANQLQCKASYFDGSNDYLSSTGLGASDEKEFTLSMVFKQDSSVGNQVYSGFGNGTSYSFFITFNISNFNIIGKSSIGGTTVLDVTLNKGNDFFDLRTNQVTISVDLTNASNRKIVVDGIDETVNATWSTYTDTAIDFTVPEYNIGSLPQFGSPVGKHSQGEVYFDTVYEADLTPFWNSDTNRPRTAKEAKDLLISTPLICMAISADDPEDNSEGSGGDFTLNGGGLVGARGATEYISRSAKFGDGSTTLNKTNYLENTSMTPSSTNSFSFVCSLETKDFTLATDILIMAMGGTNGIVFKSNISENLVVYIGNSQTVLASSLFNTAGYKNIFVTYDGANLYAHTSLGETNTAFSTSATFDTSVVSIGSASADLNGNTSYDWRGNIASTYYTETFIDFSQESNRNIFINQLGYPKDLTQAIADAEIPNGLIRVGFKDPDNLGKNDGTGGDFTIQGTVTSGADFNI